MRTATCISNEGCLSFALLFSQKGRLSAQPNSSLRTSNLGLRVLMYTIGGTVILLSISAVSYTRPLLALFEPRAVSGAAPSVLLANQKVSIPVALHINKAIIPPK